MSLIHKALKKAEGEPSKQIDQSVSTDEFVGEKPSLSSQITPRTIILFVLMLVTLFFVIYKKFHKKTFVPQPIAPITSVSPSAATQQPQIPSNAEANAQPAVPEYDALTGVLVEEGKKLYAVGQYDQALVKFTEASQKSPTSAEIMNNIGLVYKKKNDVVKAEEFYKKALAIKPDYPECLNNLGVLKVASGDVLDAAVYLKKAISISSTYADAYFNLAVLNEGEGNLREAINNYKLFLQYTDTDNEGLITKVKGRIEELSE